jgi:carbamate kinase
LGFGTPEERPLESLTIEQARGYLEAGEFGRGSMAPKVEACCRFVQSGGDFGVITSIEQCDAALAGAAGTWITR